jgi:hypothetical protein
VEGHRISKSHYGGYDEVISCPSRNSVERRPGYPNMFGVWIVIMSWENGRRKGVLARE